MRSIKVQRSAVEHGHGEFRRFVVKVSESLHETRPCRSDHLAVRFRAEADISPSLSELFNIDEKLRSADDVSGKRDAFRCLKHGLVEKFFQKGELCGIHVSDAMFHVRSLGGTFQRAMRTAEVL